MSCNQTPSQVEKDYIKNLEEKNKVLEKELQDIKSKTEPNHISDGATRNSASHKGYFTIGSTEDEVLNVMGDPSSINDMGIIGKIFRYGYSSVTFEDGRVKDYDNYGKNLKVKVKR